MASSQDQLSSSLGTGVDRGLVEASTNDMAEQTAAAAVVEKTVLWMADGCRTWDDPTGEWLLVS